MTAGERAAGLVESGQVVGLGTGRAAGEFLRALARRIVAEGLAIRGVPTSLASARLADELGIPLADPDEVEAIDIAVDGADEVGPGLDLIKGWGGALVREKIVAASARRFVVVATASKRVERLGARGKLPVEVLPFGWRFCERRIRELGLVPSRRVASGGSAFISDNGNFILDCAVGALDDAGGLDRQLRAIPGVVGTGFFLGMAHLALIQDGESVEELAPAR